MQGILQNRMAQKLLTANFISAIGPVISGVGVSSLLTKGMVDPLCVDVGNGHWHFIKQKGGYLGGCARWIYVFLALSAL